MSLNSEINRIISGKNSIKQSILSMGGSVTENSLISDYNTFVRNIPSDSITYNNWISYGLTEPDPTIYKYWLPIDTTPINTPIKQIWDYTAIDTYTGDLAEFIYDNGTMGSSGSTSYTPQIYGNYGVVCSARPGSKPGNYATMTIYDLTNVDNPLEYMSNSDNKLRQFYIKDYCGTSMVKGAWMLYNNKIYMMYTSTYTHIYDITTNTCSNVSRSWTNDTNWMLGMTPIGNNNCIIFVTSTSKAETANRRVIVSKLEMTNFTKVGSTLSDTNVEFDITSYYHLICVMDGIAYFGENDGYVYDTSHMFGYNMTKSSPSKITITLPSGTSSFTKLITADKLIWRCSDGTLKTLNKNGSFSTFSITNYGNLFVSLLKSGASINTDSNFTSYVATISSTSLKMDGGPSYKLATSGDYSYIHIEDDIINNYTYSHDIIENNSSLNNVLCYSSQNGSALSYVYKLYKNSQKKSFIPVGNSGLPKLCYNKQNVALKISNGTTWTDFYNDENDRLSI